MKKRLCILLMVAAVFSMSACSLPFLKDKESVETTEEESETEETDETEEAPDETEDDTPGEPVAVYYFGTDDFLMGRKIIYYIDGDDLQQICELNPEDGSVFDDVFANGERACFFSKNFEESEYTIHMLDDEFNMKEYDFGTLYPEGFSYVTPAGFYDGKFYIGVTDEQYEHSFVYFDPEKETICQDTRFSYLGNLLFDELEYNYIREEEYMVKEANEFGAVFAADFDNGLLRKYNLKGAEIDTYQLPNGVNNISVLENGKALMNFAEYGEEGYHYIYYEMDLEDGSYCQTGVNEEDDGRGSFIMVNDGLPIFAINRYNSLYDRICGEYYIMSDNTSELIARVDGTIPSDFYYENGNDAFCVKGDRYYFLATNSEGTDTVWKYVDKNELNKIIETDYTDEHIALSDYGKLEYISDEFTDDNGLMYYSYSNQIFTLNSNLEGADKVNEVLRTLDDEYMGYCDSIEELAVKDILENEYYEDYSEYGMTYQTSRAFLNINEIGSKYYQIGFETYEYFGGAHGYPYDEYFLIDKETGERVEFKDFYTGSDEEFVDIVARYSLEDWKNDDEYYYMSVGDVEDENEMLESFKETISIDHTIEFTEDGILFYYTPYEVGPYASGYIGIAIPYSEFGITMP